MYKAVSKPVTTPKPLLSPTHRPGVSETLKQHPRVAKGLGQGECLAQIESLVSSSLLQGSESLCKLLQYLAHHTLHSPTVHLKEYQIATEVFGRPPGFDPQSDASVRVQVGRLRNKLAEYYQSFGINDPILIDVPKGRYTLSFERRSVTPKPEAAAEAVSSSSVLTEHLLIRRSVATALAVVTSIFLAGGILIYFLHPRAAAFPIKSSAADRSTPTALQTFWSPFLRGPDQPFVVYSNAAFVGSPNVGMHYFRPSKDSPEQISQLYTGVGEVMGVLELDQLFRGLGGRFRVKRGGLFTLDDAHNNNLIFVGSPMENLTLGQIPNTREFVFRWQSAGPNRTEEVIVNLHPQAGESAVYPATPQMLPMRLDYSVVALMHGLDRARWTLILAGASTIGTQAAVDYVCDRSSVEDLLRRLNLTTGKELKPFEALLQVKIANDVPLQTQLVALRETHY
jgi:hypothetical protein